MDIPQRNARIFDPIYASTAVLSETFSNWDDAMGERWLRLYRNILWGYDAVNPLTDAEKKAAPLVLLANQMICVAWFSTQEKYPEAYDANKRMTRWLIDKLDELKIG
jgi:Ser/Thr protein kinase RdoA (MazF antagonist)